MLLLQALRDGVNLSICLRNGDARCQPPHDREPSIVARCSAKVERHWSPDVDGAQVSDLDRRLEDSENGATDPVQHEAASDDRGIACVATHPELMTEHDDRRRAQCVGASIKQASGSRPQSPHVEEVCGDFQ